MNPSVISALQQMKQNPMQFLLARRFNIPNTVNMNDSNEIIQYLINSGQVSQDQVNQANMNAKNNQQLKQFLGRK